MRSSLEIAQKAPKRPIATIARKAGIPLKALELYGNDKAKVDHRLMQKLVGRKDGKLILVTSMNPTRFGEGKTVTTIGLGQALTQLRKKTFICLRQPSMGPVFGVKGGACGGGYSQVLPMEDINLLFTGDFPAVSAAANLLAAIIDNHLSRGNALKIDPVKITWKRAIDMNDRSLRDVTICHGHAMCVEREGHFVITAASEVMACLCLANDLGELRRMLGEIVVGYDIEGKPVQVKQLKVQGAMTALLVRAMNPNLVQAIEGTPAFVHGGPFANIAHGTNSVVATRIALKLADYVVTEAGFGSDLGLEKFMDIVARKGKYEPAAVVVVATLKALKHHGGAEEPKERNLVALEKGFANLEKHLENAKLFGLNAVVAINRFPFDSAEEMDWVQKHCAARGVKAVASEVFTKGGKGGLALAKAVLEACAKPSLATPLYALSLSLREKIEAVARGAYGAEGTEFSEEAQAQLKRLEELGYGKLPVCISKTQFSLSDDPEKLGRPRGFKLRVRGVEVAAGAGFVVAYSGDLISLPGLPEKPAAENIDVDEDGRITGLS